MMYLNTNCNLFSHDKLLWHLDLHSLFDFLHEKKLFRYDVLQLHFLYLWPPNSDAFPTHSLNKTLIDGTSEILTVPSVTCCEFVTCIQRI